MGLAQEIKTTPGFTVGKDEDGFYIKIHGGTIRYASKKEAIAAMDKIIKNGFQC